MLPFEKEEEGGEKQEEGAMGYISKGFFSIVGAAKEIGQKAKVTIEEAKLGEKITQAGNVMAQTAVTAGTYVFDKTKVAAEAVKQKSHEIAVLIVEHYKRYYRKVI